MMNKTFLCLVGAIFVGLGLYNLFLPADGIAIYGIDLVEISAVNEIRANYGGMHLLLGIFFLYGAWRPAFTSSALIVVALFTGGLVLGRVVSLVLDGNPNLAVWAFLGLEATGCLTASLLLVKLRNKAFS